MRYMSENDMQRLERHKSNLKQDCAKRLEQIGILGRKFKRRSNA
jgi:hypothetical protein